MTVMIPKYPGEAREEYEKRKANMLAALPSLTTAPNPHPSDREPTAADEGAAPAWMFAPSFAAMRSLRRPALPRVPRIDEAYDPAIHLPPGDSIYFSGATPIYHRASDGARFEV